MIRSIFASLVTIIFNFVFLVSFVLFVLLNTLLTPDFYKSDDANKFYESSIDLFSTFIYRVNNEVKLPLTKEEIKNEVRAVYTPEDIRNTLTPFVEQVINPSFDDDGMATIKLDFSGVVDKLPKFGENLAKKLYVALPKCGKNDPEDAIGKTCLPKSVSISDFQSQLSSSLDKELFSKISSKSLVFNINRNSMRLNGFNLDKSLFWDLWWLLLVIQMFLLLLVALIIFKPWYRIVKWVSKPIISGSFVAGLFFIALYEVPDFMAKFMGSGPGKDLTEEEMGTVISFVKSLLWLVVDKALWFAGILFVFGLAVYIFGLWGKKHYSHGGVK
jgi:hypothetical protein